MRSGVSFRREGRHRPEALRIAGVTPFTSIDFPGRLAAIVHLQGCPLACPYCHAPHLRPPGPGRFGWTEITALLDARRGLLDGVVITGGEPCAQTALGPALCACRSQGYATALHTSGLYPGALSRLLPDLDWIGLDWKSPPDATRRATGRDSIGHRFARSLDIVLASGIAHEIRTTWHPALLSAAEMTAMARHLARAGADSWIIRPCRPPATQCGLAMTMRPFPSALLDDLRAIMPDVVVRLPP